ncbi:MAG TPA: LD-carboxypeptidase [Caulobacteraceae bacterium]|jgi:muramoyltetrapeptide carboxypeptidase|nr:LD-carboxypeptidase [Caulobacteraceae bacterium]
MSDGVFRIAVAAPGSRIEPDLADRLTALTAEAHGDRVQIHVHPQCFLSHGHFAGDDATRATAFVEMANDPALDALWFARGGYGSCRLIEAILPRLAPAARDKTYLGYSDAGSLLSALRGLGFEHLAHGPMPIDLSREGGGTAVLRALAWLVDRAPETLEPSLQPGIMAAAFNLTILSQLIGTPYQPDLTGHVLMLEEVSEHLYAIDRHFFHLTSTPALRQVAGIRLGRCSAIPPNTPPFGQTEEEIARAWCERSGIPYLGRADIGHDAENKIVPFGMV